ncbi:MAG: S1 RNA-binding domain-containing protein [Chloroflexi bacterium]|nr:S1 RNA-binding domain-containing protein [Chloroflexota bacterium]
MEESHWSIADGIAQELVKQGTDVNEVAKVSGYLSQNRNRADFFKMLDLLERNGKRLARSQQTARYYADIRQACQRLKPIADAGEMAEILGWAVRLMRYYPRASQVAERPTTPPSHPPAATGQTTATTPAAPTAQVSRLEDLQVDMVLEGRVTGIQPFGAFVDIGLGRGKEGLVHISQLSERRVADVASVVSAGQSVRVKVVKIEPQPGGRVRIGLTMKGVPQP